ncbi:uncharacterized protein LOC123471463 isoform X2 [Daphnia magna]|uniref:uncharacterized protein LOC116920361 isoform X2 n=1 Tax=Daphnia magna TaxID=35525 RepID=UPI001E1BD36D|nr:uncharacterized protein LOC116920361 isoform X2 [Daphnia magna]XP_045028745.1 uncharacterized protein LOC123471463 isoform X2 [Daphnia magna]
MLMYWSSRWNVSGLRETRVGPAFSSSYISTLLDASGGFRTLGVLLGEGDVDSVIRRVRSAAITSYRAVSLAVVVVCCGKLLSAYRHGAIMGSNRLQIQLIHCRPRFIHWRTVYIVLQKRIEN